MPALNPPVCDFDWPAPAFLLPATDGKAYALSDVAGSNGTLIMFICNHCPYVVGVIDRLVRDAGELQSNGVGVAAICSNDAEMYPQDGIDPMTDFARDHGFTFPYLHDEDQSVAKAYGAVCTPDFFGFNAVGGLQYRGRLDAAGRMNRPSEAERELFHAMIQVAKTGQGPLEQVPSMGCSIKWR
ncbi:thioredoxin family protein [Cognatishimia activa]|uniref:thioredoxin family protein n=1 Tax=Cognatishimia activa TaxID=1715691 RepID=UPI0022317AEC|nr:thioredoxin family protein [Cognatishimia activa]UZD92267.1 thioredoxin family protein [Cognatishimia activa]